MHTLGLRRRYQSNGIIEEKFLKTVSRTIFTKKDQYLNKNTSKFKIIQYKKVGITVI